MLRDTRQPDPACTGPPCLSRPQGVQAGAWLPARRGDSPCSLHPTLGLGLGSPNSFPPLPTPRVWGLSPSPLSPPAAEAEHVPIPPGSCAPIPTQPSHSGARPSSNLPRDRLGVSGCSPKSGSCTGGTRLRPAGGRPRTGGAGGGRGRSLGNSQTTATGPTGRTRLPGSRDADPGAGQAAEQGLQLEQRPRQGLPARPRRCQTSTPSFSMI